MRIEQLMSQPVHTCEQTQTLERAAQIMWECDCGAVPIVDASGHITGMLTDRDISMAAYTQGRAPSAIPVESAMAKVVYSCRPDETIESAEETMRERQIRRVPVVDDAGHPIGMLSLNDLARNAVFAKGDGRAVTQTLAAVCEPRHVAVQRRRNGPKAARAHA